MTSPREPDAREALAPRCYFCGDEIERNSDRWGHFYFCGCGARGPYGKTPSEARERYAALRQPAAPGGEPVAWRIRWPSGECQFWWCPELPQSLPPNTTLEALGVIASSPPPSDERAKVVELTDAMLNAHLQATGEWAKPYPAEYECGSLIDDGMSQEMADEINENGREALRKGYAAALSPSTPPTESELRQARESSPAPQGGERENEPGSMRAQWTYDDEARAYYFAPLQASSPPYTTRTVEAVLDIASDGTLAGVELVEMATVLPPPPLTRCSSPAATADEAYRETVRRIAQAREERLAAVTEDNARLRSELDQARGMVETARTALDEIADLGANGATSARLGNIAHAALLAITSTERQAQALFNLPFHDETVDGLNSLSIRPSTSSEDCSCIGAVIGQHDKSCPYSVTHTSPERQDG